MRLRYRLLAIVIGSGIIAERLACGYVALALLANTLATVFGLYVLIEVFGPVSGAGKGMMTFVRGALPAELYGREHYGAINGAPATPVLLSKAAEPVLAAWLLGWLAPLPLIGVLAALGAVAALLFAQAIPSHRTK